MNEEIGTEAAQFLLLGIHKWDFRCSVEDKPKGGDKAAVLNISWGRSKEGFDCLSGMKNYVRNVQLYARSMRLK
jgi:hypothetical protein